ALRAVEEAVGEASTYGLRAKGALTVVGPRLLPLEIKVSIEPDPGADFVTLEQDAKSRIAGLLNHVTGGFDGQGWRVGEAPRQADIAAVLQPLMETAVVSVEAIGRKGPKSLPDELPVDVLVQAAPADVSVVLTQKATV